MRATNGVGLALLCGAFFCVGTAAAQPVTKAPPVGSGGASGAVDTPGVTKAREHFRAGRAAAEKGDWEAAYAAQRAAYSLYPHWQVAGALGDAAFVRGKYPEAIVMLTQNLREATDLDAAERAVKEKRVELAKARCGKLAVSGPAGAILRVDGEPVGALPLEEEPYVLPGKHTVEGVVPSGVQKRVVEVEAGKSSPVELNPPPPPPKRPEPPPPPTMVPVVLLGTAAGLGAVAGGVLLGISVAKGDEAARKLDAVKNEPRPCMTPACKEVHGLLVDQDKFESAARGVWIGAGVAGLAAATVAIVQSRRRTSHAATLAPVVSPTGAGLVVSGSF